MVGISGTGYSGGTGDGYSNQYSVLLPLIATNTGYSGGSDDGFSSQLAIRSYIFIGGGNWDIAGNWYYNTIPPSSLPAGSMILIDPSGVECILNVPQTILTGASITIMTGKKLRILGSLILQ